MNVELANKAAEWWLAISRFCANYHHFEGSECAVLLVAALARLLLSPLAWLERPPQRHHHLALASHYRRLVMALPRM